MVLQFAREHAAHGDLARAARRRCTLQAAIGKFVIAVDEDIDPENADAVFWAMAYRCNPVEDTQIVRYRELGHGPRIRPSRRWIRRC